MKIIVAIASVCLLGTAWAANVVLPCEGTDFRDNIVRVFVDDVECTKAPCQLPRGSVASCDITFTALNEVTSLTKKVNATVVGTGVTTPFPLPDANKGCESLQNGGYCPLDEGEEAVLRITMPISALYPKVGLSLLFFGNDQRGYNQYCFILPAEVTDK